MASPTELIRAALRAAEPVEVTCPRCGGTGPERFYGPCTACREVLRAEQGAAARQVEAEEYVPKMNVTPNAVALKE
jgi:rubredoxin